MRLGFVLLAVALDAVTSHAAVTTQVGSFDMSTPFVQGSGATADPGFSFFDRFDASLGTLTRVDIDISVATLVQGVLPLSQICSIGCVPVPYPFTFQIVHDFGLWPIPGGPTNPRIE